MACMLHLFHALGTIRITHMLLRIRIPSNPINTLIGFPLLGLLPSTYSHDYTFMRAINLGPSYSVNQKSSPPLIGSLDAVDSESRDVSRCFVCGFLFEWSGDSRGFPKSCLMGNKSHLSNVKNGFHAVTGGLRLIRYHEPWSKRWLRVLLGNLFHK